jgi:hypothetical protein
MPENRIDKFETTEKIIQGFFDFIRKNNLNLYNEFSFQFEFGIFLRKEFPKLKVEFERNVEILNKNKDIFTKKEIDVIVYNDLPKGEKDFLWAIELKFPRKGQTPEQMFKIVEDIKFCEELSSNGFRKATQITLVDEEYQGKSFFEVVGKNDGIYKYFRSSFDNKFQSIALENTIYKPTGKQKDEMKYQLKGKYNIEWRKSSDLKQKIVYFFIDVDLEKKAINIR